MAWYAIEMSEQSAPNSAPALFEVFSEMGGRKDFEFVYLRISTHGRMYCFSSELPSIIEEFRKFTSMKIIEMPSNLEEFQKIKV
jgi:hypothetical protein